MSESPSGAPLDDPGVAAPLDDPAVAASRELVYRTFAAEGRPPSLAEAAELLGRDSSAVRSDWLRLHDAHQLVLTARRDAVRMAHPFSAWPMGFVVAPDPSRSNAGDDRLWWGGCAWDSFGISAALWLDVAIHTRCPGCGEPLTLHAGAERAPDTGRVVHVPVPAVRWWDDIVRTCSHIRLFCGPGHVARWAERTKSEIGQIVDAERIWRLAGPWYGDRLDPGYRPRPRDRSQRLLDDAGLRGEFWRLP